MVLGFLGFSERIERVEGAVRRVESWMRSWFWREETGMLLVL